MDEWLHKFTVAVYYATNKIKRTKKGLWQIYIVCVQSHSLAFVELIHSDQEEWVEETATQFWKVY